MIRTLSIATSIVVAGATGASASSIGDRAAPASPPAVQVAASFLAANLTGANEVPPADPDGTGAAVLRVRGTELCFSLRWNAIGTPTAAHLHGGPAGVNGPVLAAFFTVALPASLRAVVGCVTVEPGLAQALVAAPANFYVNVHNAQHPGGAIRAQLGPTRPTDLLNLLRGPLVAVADGSQEVPDGADPDGHGVAFVRGQAMTITFAVNYGRITPPTAAHIHTGVFGVNGPVAVGFFSAPGGLPANFTAVSGVVNAAAPLVAQINSQPGNYYVNLHTADFPGGAIRGQLFRAG
ncbi:MAG TPA: CHRD domain-containing protein [Pilimelia sp.]|nr:CHRD domain-containing protein [Pilimelia sp.]